MSIKQNREQKLRAFVLKHLYNISTIQENEQPVSPNCGWVKADGVSEGTENSPGKNVCHFLNSTV